MREPKPLPFATHAFRYIEVFAYELQERDVAMMGSKKTDWTLIRIIAAGLILFGAVLLLWWFTPTLLKLIGAQNDELHGQFGDQFGWINALFSGCAFVGLIIAILLQWHELGLQRQDLKVSHGEMEKSTAQLTAQSNALLKSAEAAERSAKAAEETLVATNRPWIAVDVKPGGPIRKEGTQVHFPIQLVLTNTGRSPALNVVPDVAVLLNISNTDLPNILKNIITEVGAQPPQVGYSLFPGQTVVHGIDKEKGDAAGGEYRPVIIGAVNYRTTIDEVSHQTGFIAKVRRKGRASPEFQFDTENVPTEEILFVRSIYEGGFIT